MSRRVLPTALPVASSRPERLAWSGRLAQVNVQTTPTPKLGTRL
jgi:hypothetical protein